MIATPAWPPRSLARLYVAPPLSAGVLVVLDGGQANYLGNVLRLKVGDPLLLFDGVSGEWLASVAEVGK
jgi:16S rRNA (uracil1498-N3)-methyltransferase